MSYVKIWIHAVWSTKYNHKILTKEVRDMLFPHIVEYNRSKGIYVDCVNGWTDHVHALISMGKEQSIASVMQSIKGESAHWFNKQEIISKKIRWQNDYWAGSVNPRGVRNVRIYIANQEIKHAKQSFEKEIEELEKELKLVTSQDQ